MMQESQDVKPTTRVVTYNLPVCGAGFLIFVCVRGGLEECKYFKKRCKTIYSLEMLK